MSKEEEQCIYVYVEKDKGCEICRNCHKQRNTCASDGVHAIGRAEHEIFGQFQGLVQNNTGIFLWVSREVLGRMEVPEEKINE